MAMSVYEKVQKLIEIAENPTTPVGEAEAARLMADKLMIDHMIEETELDKHRMAADRMKPGSVDAQMIGDYELVGYVDYLIKQVALHTGCRVRTYTQFREGTYWAKVYGFDSDLRYFNMLYTTLRLHMVGALRPRPNPALSIEENAYILHNSGLNWFDIAKLHGWEEITPKGIAKPQYRNIHTGDVQGWPETIGIHKRAYAREIKRRGEQPVKISPAGVKTFQRSAAEGYVRRMAQRLREVRDKQPIGNVLAMRVDMVDALFKQDNPDLFKTPEPTNGRKVRARKYRAPAFNEQAYRTGVNVANTASLSPQTSSGSKGREIK